MRGKSIIMGKKKQRNKPKEKPKEEPKKKPIDRWLGLGGLGVGIMLYLLPKTQPIVIICLITIFALLISPIWNLWWIERSIWRRLVALIGLCIGLMILGIYVWPCLMIIPQELQFPVSEWDTTKVVEIKNNMNTVYSTMIKIVGENDKIDLDNIELIAEDYDKFPSQSIGPLTVNFAIVIFKVIDIEKKPCVYLLIYRIKAYESVFLKIKNTKKQGKEPFLVSLKVVSYSDKPAPIFTKDKGAGILFTINEALTIKSTTFLLKKDLN